MTFTDEQLEAALEALSDPERFKGAAERLGSVAPQLQRILGHALAEGGWFDAGHENQIAAALDSEDAQERLARVRTLLAEETRIGMLIGVAVGWELHDELDKGD